MLASFVVTAIAAGLVVVVVRLLTNRKRYQNLPPGPPGKPLIGNLPDIPPYHSWLKFKEWADQYGPLFTLNIAGRRHVVISTEKIANDLLRERGTYYSSREYLPFAAGLVSHDLRPLLLPYNDLWRKGRKLMHRLTMPAAADSYQPVQEYESNKLLLSLLQDPRGYEKWFERYASGVIFKVAFGKWVVGDEPELQRIKAIVHTVERVASPGAYLVDSVPVLGYLPEFMAPFKREGRLLHDEEIDLFRLLQQNVRNELKTGSKCGNSFTRTFLENQEQFDLSDDEGAYVIGTLFEAASGTTAAAMMSFCLAMCHFPEWQVNMQAELDEIVGERMPGFEDIPNLPTVRAVIKEVLRWRPVTAGGVPHQLTKDDTYDGFFFPKDTVFHANQWAIHREPELYPDPDNFRPDRWLNRDFPTFREPLDKYPTLQNFSAFGFGRRICPGQNIAERSLNILSARIAWAMTLSSDKTDLKPLAAYDYTTGFNVQPKWFKFTVSPRRPDTVERIENLVKQSRPE